MYSILHCSEYIWTCAWTSMLRGLLGNWGCLRGERKDALQATHSKPCCKSIAERTGHVQLKSKYGSSHPQLYEELSWVRVRFLLVASEGQTRTSGGDHRNGCQVQLQEKLSNDLSSVALKGLASLDLAFPTTEVFRQRTMLYEAMLQEGLGIKWKKRLSDP